MQEIEKKNKELLEEVEKLKRQVKILKVRKKYGLVFEEEREPEQIVLDCQIKIPILKEDKPKEIISDKEKPVNVLIEGDNYHALSVLNYTHKGAVDVIYIDPPYNTGNKDFVYNDKYVDSEDSFRHSKWLSFMGKRLKLAKNLMRSTGIIFISIDDNELANLKLLCDEIFGLNHFISIFVWKRRSGANDPKNLVSTDHEYILCYKKSDRATLRGIKKDLSNYKNPDNNPKGPWIAGDLTCGKTKDERPNLFYEIIDPSSKKVYKANQNRVWIFEESRMLREIKEGKIIFPKKEGGTPQYKRFANNLRSNFKPLSTWIEASVVNKKDILNEEEKHKIRIMQSDLNQTATKELRELMGRQLFNYPKPKRLITELIKHSASDECMVLDFMAGSGTTAHAVLELNKEDKGNRRFILCTNNENNIATDVCYPRIKKVIGGHKKWQDITKIPANLKYFKTELLDIDHISHVSDEQKIKLTYCAGEMIALREGAFIEIEKDDWWQIFRDETKYTAIYFKEDKKKLNDLIKKLSKLNEKVVLYIFSWGKNEYKNEFIEYKNIKVEDIPEPIIDVYKEVNRLSW